LIISPHYPPSNLAAVHRSRLFAQHLPAFGWEPVILTVDERFYEEPPDWNLHKLIPVNQMVYKVDAFRITRPRIIGDIGLRAFFQLRKKALQLVKTEKINFVFILIPSFYISLIGPYLNRKTGVKYGIDYIDPWVHTFPGSEQLFSRHWFSTQLAKLLEPVAVKKASLISGVAEGYYKGVKERNPHLLEKCLFGAMPYGGDLADHRQVKTLGLTPYLFQRNTKLQFVYAGAMLPKAYSLLECIFRAIASKKDNYKEVEFHFIGTGKATNDQQGYNIKQLAEQYRLWETVVFEYPQRIPYLDVLVHLAAADAVFILGSTEPHYTPSKTYQAVLSNKPIMAVLHSASTAVDILRSTNTGIVLDFAGESAISTVEKNFNIFFDSFKIFRKAYDPSLVSMRLFEPFSAKEITRKLVMLLNEIS
jgi:hypothetical protein